MRLKVGDIFSIKIDDDRFGYGQIIIKPKFKLFIVVFPEVYDKSRLPQINEIVNFNPLLMGYTLDGLIFNGDWKVIGNYKKNLGDYPLPFFKIGIPPEVFLTNHKGDKIRKATGKEGNMLSYETVLSPIYYEEALKAYHKIIPWDKSYDEILYENIKTQISVVT